MSVLGSITLFSFQQETVLQFLVLCLDVYFVPFGNLLPPGDVFRLWDMLGCNFSELETDRSVLTAALLS